MTEPVGPTISRLKARIRELEAILLCKACGHLRNEHMDNDSPCYGGRTPEMAPTEGAYCSCDGFTSGSA